MDYVAYSDESYIGQRFVSIASFSCRADKLDTVNSELNALLLDSDVAEFKWQKLKDAKYRHCALKLMETVWKFLYSADLRIDVIVWDTHDSRHSIHNRDDTANYGRMFFHLHSQSLKRRPRNASWSLYPDEKIEIDWDTINQCLTAIGHRRQYIESPLLGNFFADPYYKVKEFQQVESHKEPCCQIADLFAGLAVFSRTHYDLFNKWKMQSRPTLGLWSEPEVKTTNREENRFQVLRRFNAGCKSRKLGVSLKTRGYLYTPNPKNPINFWHYEPQHNKDKAPIRGNYK